MHCPLCTSEGRLKSVVMVPQKSLQTEKFLMMRNMWEEEQATGGQLDPEVNALK